MRSSSLLLASLAVISSLVTATPLNGPASRMLHAEVLHKRQDGDVEEDSATDPLRDGKQDQPFITLCLLTVASAINYASVFSAQATVTYSAVSTGAQATDAQLVATTTVTPGNNAVGPPPDTNEQGPRYVVDHILELQFVVGAFQVNPRPTTGATSIPVENWESASIACFTKTRNYPPQTSIASAFSGTFNLNGIPSRFNGFKQQVFTGRMKSNPNNPSARTYPQDFGFALQKFLEDNEDDVYAVVDDVGAALSSDAVGNYSAIKPYFTAYAQNEYRSAIDFLSAWVGTSYTPNAGTATRTSTADTTSSTATAVDPQTTTDVDTPPVTSDPAPEPTETEPASTVNLGKLKQFHETPFEQANDRVH
ncbi:MAG: hypothetical protein Q9186_007365 [Xanthomendoza sp. 1 TL-2023]